MDKIKINNQVVVMRKFVKQGKIRVINKFVKEIQLLRNRKGNEQKITKCQRKADRLLEEVAILKKIKPDTVSRMALSKSKDWKAILSQKGVSPEERCFALLASYGPVQEEVSKFYSENSYLTPKIPTLIQEWEDKVSNFTPLKNHSSFKAKSKSNEIKSNPSGSAKDAKLIKEQLGKKDLGTKKPSITQKDGEEKDVTLKVRDSDDMMDSDSGDEASKDIRNGYFEVGNRSQEESDGNEEENESDDDDDEREGYLGNRDGQEDSDDNDENSDDQEESDESDMHSDEEKEGNTCNNELKNKTSRVKESKLKKEPAKFFSKTEPLSPAKSMDHFKNKIPSLQKNVPLEANSTKAVALVNLNELMDMDEIPIVSGKTEEKQASEFKKVKKDSFFLKDGVEEFSESDQSDEDSNEEEGAFTHKNVYRNSSNKKNSFAEGRTQMKDNSHNFRNKGFSRNASQGRKFERGEQKFRDNFHSKQKFNKFVKNESLPYSDQQSFKKNQWNKGHESKRKGSKPFEKFPEKKQTFSKNKPDNHPRNNIVKKEETPLHPSWEAKRKMKQAANTKFQGKRMVFDD